jgi:superfamily II DNA/RNA helicase
LFDGIIYKLHGDLEHEYRKMNYFAFDKIKSKDDKKGGLLICTDVASRGLDFKNVDWII